MAQSQFDIFAVPVISPLRNTEVLTAAAAALPAESNIQRGHPYLQPQKEGRRNRDGREGGRITARESSKWESQTEETQEIVSCERGRGRKRRKKAEEI